MTFKHYPVAELREFEDDSFDDPEFARNLLTDYDPALRNGLPRITRKKPCADCAVMTGLYSDIAACGYKYLDEDDRKKAASKWSCHNGGRCEGAARVLGINDNTQEAPDDAPDNS